MTFTSSNIEKVRAVLPSIGLISQASKLSVITKDVKENSLALERSEQEEIENYKRKK